MKHLIRKLRLPKIYLAYNREKSLSLNHQKQLKKPLLSPYQETNSLDRVCRSPIRPLILTEIKLRTYSQEI